MTTEQIEPHPYACQIEGCRGRIGQEVIDLGPSGKIRVCLYHSMLLMTSRWSNVSVGAVVRPACGHHPDNIEHGVCRACTEGGYGR